MKKVSYKHLVEFNQIEGIVVGKDANLRNLMGIQREFYKRIGITKLNFGQLFPIHWTFSSNYGV